MYHNHHIIPKHAGGTDEPSNLIRLTVEEHAEAHRLLFEEHGRWEDEVAWKALSGQITLNEASKLAHRLGSTKGGKSNSANNTGFCGRSKEQMSADGRKAGKASQAKRNPEDNAIHLVKAREAIEIDRIENPEKYVEKSKRAGASTSKTVRRKMAEGTYENSGLLTSEKGKQMAKLNNGPATCPHCAKEGQYRAMKRWHFDNCKNNPNL